jgi:hypothetical protein
MFVTQTPSMMNMYWMVLGQFMEGGQQGLQVLSDVWISDGDPNTGDWHDQIREYVRGEGAGELPRTNQLADELGEDVVAASSYRYVTSAMTDPRVSTMVDRFNTVDPNFDYYSLDGPTSQEEFYNFIKRNRTSDIKFGSRKALFYMNVPFHNPPQIRSWFFDGADCPVALGDGSARNTNPQSDGAPFNALENAGAPTFVLFTGPNDSARYDCYYYKTAGGIRGRDLR